ncbi:glycosyltransferase family 1 protein [soil metagenome]
MIRHSGIGVFLRNLLAQWAIEPPAFSLHLLGDPELLRDAVPANLNATIAEWTPRLYALAGALFPPTLPADVAAWYSPHYATCLRGKLPLVCHVQDVLHITHPTANGTRVYMQSYLSFLRRRAAYILTTSRHVKVQLQTLYRFEPSRVLITGVGPGILGPAAKQGARSYQFPPRYLLAVGIDKPHKNWKFLLERLAAMKSISGLVVPPKARPHASLPPLVALGLGKDEQKIRAQAAALNLTANDIIFPGSLTDADMAAAYAGAAALLFPSIAEGFGLPILEAMASGAPLLIADRSPMREIAAGCAWTFDPDWPETFDAALRDLLTNTPERARLIDCAKTRAAEFTWSKTARHVEAAIMRAVTGELPGENV